ncbi:adhesion G protein-coupled receptor A3 [Macrobrachium rosenbergii]|uniref:adhesion G protein-coupled receptor A3 n=1 Tax=Macrobrachium rosenbergii TaxID=79674 RepID=UPI0034D64043
MKRSTALRPCPSTPVPFLPTTTTVAAARFFSAHARALFWIWVALLIIGARGGDNSVSKGELGEKEWGDVGGEDLVSLAELEDPLPPPTTPPLPAHVTPASLQCEDLCGHEETASESAIRGTEPLSLKVWCRNHHLRITSLFDVFPQCIPNNTKILDLSGNGITRLPAGVLSHLHILEKLDLKKNDISIIEPGAFANLTSLRKLDLANNAIGSLNASQVHGLHKLQRLKIGRNPLARLHEGIQDELESLKLLDAPEAELVCDCGLRWLTQAIADKQFRLSPGTKCFRPRSLNGTQIKKLSPQDMQCHGPGLSVVELEPGLDQVVFAGDSLRLRCRVTSAEEGHKVWWVRGDVHLVPRHPSTSGSTTVTGYLEQHHQHQQRGGAVIKTTYLPESIESMVEIKELNGTHSGDWSCLVQGEQGNHTTSTISIYVITHDTRYCPMNTTSNNRGSYVWPRTVAGVTVELACAGLLPHLRGSSKYPTKASLKAAAAGVAISQAKHTCSLDGYWEGLDTSACPFVSETTKILEQFASTNIPASKTSLADSTRSLRNFTRDGKILRDPMDIIFLAKTVEQYTSLLGALSGPKETALVLIEIISASMAAAQDLLYAAEVLDGACQRLVKCLWEVANHSPKLTRAPAPQLEMHQFARQPSTFSGLTCNWYRRSPHNTERHFRCNTHNYSMLYSSEDEIMDAQIQVPSSLFRKENLPAMNSSDDLEESATQSSVQLQFFVYQTANLFPRVLASKSDTWEVTSPVIGVRVSDQDEDILLDDHVYITLRSAIYSHNIMPVWWKRNASGTQGNWTSEGCKIEQEWNSLIVFRCDRLAHFGLLQDMAALHRSQAGARGAEFRLSAPGVYVGSAICILFLMASIITWAANHHCINTMNKNKHSLMNTWIALLLLVTLFTVGVYQTENQKLCQGIGVALHYLTTCVLLWIIVTVTNLYKKVTKALRPPVPVEEPPQDIPLPPKPMLRFYLVGWGIALILCGISAAVNLQQYAGYSYCFLAWGPSLGAFYAPTAALAFILSTFFLLTHCMLRSHRTTYNEATGATETTELELLDANSPNSENVNPGAEDELSIASRDTTVSVSDGQHSPLTQLRAHVVTLLLFILTWAAAAITTAAPFASVIPHHNTIFSIIYAICASSLGIFIFVFFCFSRNDVWDAWREYSCVLARQRKEEEEVHLTAPVNNSGANHIVPSNNQACGPVGAPSTHSLESSQTHQTNKSSSVSQSILTSNKPESLNKASNNLQLLSLGTMTNDLHYAPEIFYNPKQAGVAKRFFQKQRLRQMVKQNNLEVNRTDSDCNSTVYKPKISRSNNCEPSKNNFDPSCLGASSKVNNTNIHVDSMYGYVPAEFQKGGGKHACKDPTPEVLCVLGPNTDTTPMVGIYPAMTSGRAIEIDRGWSTIPRKPRAYMEEPISPMRRVGSFPSIVEEGNLTSQATSQSSALEQLPYLPQELQQPQLFNYPVLGQAPAMMPQPMIPYHNSRHHQPHVNDDALARKNRNSFNSDLTERSDNIGIPRVDHSRLPRHHKYRSGKERPRPGRPRRRTTRPKGNCALDDKDDWTDDNTSPIIINHLPSGEPGTMSSESDKDGIPHQFIPYPQQVHGISPTNAQHAVLQTSLDPHSPSMNSKKSVESACIDMSWPHVMKSALPVGKHGRERSEKSNGQCHHSYPSNIDDPSHLAMGTSCEDHGDEDCGAWDSECGDVYWCGGGEERISACEVSGCENSSLCDGACGARDDLCGSPSSEAGTSIGGASVDPAVGTSPRGSVNISDSPYDSPLHRLHQNTPDSGSLDSSLLESPGRTKYDFAFDKAAPFHSTPKDNAECVASDLPEQDLSMTDKSDHHLEVEDPDADSSSDVNNSNLCVTGMSTMDTVDSFGNSIFCLTNSSEETVLRNDGEKSSDGQRMCSDDESNPGNDKSMRTDSHEGTIDSELEEGETSSSREAESNPKIETCV